MINLHIIEKNTEVFIFSILN